MSIIATFEIAYTQCLDADGQIIGELPPFAADKQTMTELYSTMVLARAYDAKAVALQRTGKMGTYASIHGQEAIGTAIGHALKKDDVFIPYYRDYAAQIQRGVTMSAIYQYWGGDERGSAHKAHGQDFPICVPIASQCLHTAGVASAFKYRKQKRVALGCIGEGGTSEGDFYEAINVAGAWHLPAVFVVNSNYWAISVPREKQTATKTIAQKAIAAGIKGMQVDGNDLIATRLVIGEAIENARRGLGPSVIECLTYRLCDHTTADDATRYQPSPRVEQAKLEEPIRRLRLFLERSGFWSESQEHHLIEDCKKKVQVAVDEYLAIEKDSITAAFDYHYQTLPDELVEQRAYALEKERQHG